MANLVQWAPNSVVAALSYTGSNPQIDVGGSPKLLSVDDVRTVNDGTFDGVVVTALDELALDPLLEAAFRILRPDGTLVTILDRETTDGSSLRKIRLAGFVDELIPTGAHQVFVAKAKKPSFQSSVALKIGSLKVAAVKLDDDIVDEDDLLTSSDRVALSQEPSCDSTTATKKRACKNCTCGLAEKEESEKVEQIAAAATQNVKSSCGNCYLGDAFRCSTCPYSGMPPFKPGEKVKLDTLSDI